MTYTFFDHTGDVGVELAAHDLGALFADAAAAFTDTVSDRDRVAAIDSWAVQLEAGDLELLLVDWLSELLFRFETDGWLTHDAHADVNRAEDGWRLAAVAHGETFDPARHPGRVLVKAITHHGLAVRQEAGVVTARVVLDI